MASSAKETAPSKEKQRVIVTGASGFIGRHCLAPLAKQGFEVHALSQRAPLSIGSDLSEKILWHHINLLSDSARPLLQEIKPSHLLHLAWTTEHGAFWQSPENDRWLTASRALVENFYLTGGHRFVTVGSCAEYKWSEGDCEEGQTPEEPSTPYGRSKKQFSDFLADLYRVSPAKSTSVGRVFFLFGPGENQARLVPDVALALLAGKEVACSDGEQLRDFMYVEDVASALVALLNSEVTGAVNIARGEATTLRNFLLELGGQLDAKNRIRFNARPRAANDPDRLTASTRRLRDEVKWRPEFSLSEGLRRTLATLKTRAML